MFLIAYRSLFLEEDKQFVEIIKERVNELSVFKERN
jgi:hypothetical protein